MRNIRAIIAASAAGLAAGLTFAVPRFAEATTAGATARTEFTTTIINAGTGLDCLNSVLAVVRCNGRADQNWDWVRTELNLNVRNVSTGRCMVPNGRIGVTMGGCPFSGAWGRRRHDVGVFIQPQSGRCLTRDPDLSIAVVLTCDERTGSLANLAMHWSMPGDILA